MTWIDMTASKQTESNQTHSTQQVPAACRAEGSQQPVIDASADSLSPGMAPLGDVNGATGCMSDQLADVTEASCPTKSEGITQLSTSMPTVLGPTALKKPAQKCPNLRLICCFPRHSQSKLCVI